MFAHEKQFQFYNFKQSFFFLRFHRYGSRTEGPSGADRKRWKQPDWAWTTTCTQRWLVRWAECPGPAWPCLSIRGCHRLCYPHCPVSCLIRRPDIRATWRRRWCTAVRRRPRKSRRRHRNNRSPPSPRRRHLPRCPRLHRQRCPLPIPGHRP